MICLLVFLVHGAVHSVCQALPGISVLLCLPSLLSPQQRMLQRRLHILFNLTLANVSYDGILSKHSPKQWVLATLKLGAAGTEASFAGSLIIAQNLKHKFFPPQLFCGGVFYE